MKYILLVFALFMFNQEPGSVPANGWQGKISVEPQSVLVERTASAQVVNFDFRLENLGADPSRVTRVELSVYDKHGNLELRKFLDSSGLRHGAYEVLTLEPKSSAFLFNPFDTFSPAVELASLQYKFFFESGTKESVSVVTVTPKAFSPKTKLSLPLKGRVLVHDGYDFYAHHRRFNLAEPLLKELNITHNFTRYALDLCIVNERGELRRNAGDANDDWYGFGATVYAPGAGRVVLVRNELPDSIKGQSTFTLDEFRKDPLLPGGNFVVIDHLNGEYSLVAHLKRGSVRVREGHSVRRGQPIAQLGVSGDASLPHVHYELRSASSLNAYGFPPYFRNFFRVLGLRKTHIVQGPVNSGDILESR